MKKMLKIQDFADESGLSVWAIRQLIADGSIPAVRVGSSNRGKFFIPADAAHTALEAMAAANTQRAVETTGGIRRIEG